MSVLLQFKWGGVTERLTPWGYDAQHVSVYESELGALRALSALLKCISQVHCHLALLLSDSFKVTVS